ncbi:MAG: DUF6326 family protein [Anaerolineae bacterium]|jgi:phosphoglycerol transferase MdoB-like AlkP superfamily enzyme
MADRSEPVVVPTRFKLSALWVALMLTYLLGDVLRIFSGDFVVGEAAGMQASQWLYLALAAFLVSPPVMVLFSLTLKYRASRWANLILAVLLFGFNLVGLPTYPSAYDQFLIVVGLVFNLLTVWYAWRWGKPPAPAQAESG